MFFGINFTSYTISDKIFPEFIKPSRTEFEWRMAIWREVLRYISRCSKRVIVDGHLRLQST